MPRGEEVQTIKGMSYIIYMPFSFFLWASLICWSDLTLYHHLDLSPCIIVQYYACPGALRSSDHGEQQEQLVMVDGAVQVIGEHLIQWTHSRIHNYITSANIQIGLHS